MWETVCIQLLICILPSVECKFHHSRNNLLFTDIIFSAWHCLALQGGEGKNW